MYTHIWYCNVHDQPPILFIFHSRLTTRYYPTHNVNHLLLLLNPFPPSCPIPFQPYPHSEGIIVIAVRRVLEFSSQRIHVLYKNTFPRQKIKKNLLHCLHYYPSVYYKLWTALCHINHGNMTKQSQPTIPTSSYSYPFLWGCGGRLIERHFRQATKLIISIFASEKDSSESYRCVFWVLSSPTGC